MKVKFVGSYNRTFRDVELRDIKIKDNMLYIRSTVIPIRRNLIGSAYNEFLMERGYAYVEIEFKIDSYGGYMVRYQHSSNVADMLIGKTIGRLFEYGLQSDYEYPCLGENNSR